MTKMNSQTTKTKIKTKTLQNESRDENSSLENHNCATTHVTRRWTDPYSFVKKINRIRKTIPTYHICINVRVSFCVHRRNDVT